MLWSPDQIIILKNVTKINFFLSIFSFSLDFRSSFFFLLLLSLLILLHLSSTYPFKIKKKASPPTLQGKEYINGKHKDWNKKNISSNKSDGRCMHLFFHHLNGKLRSDHIRPSSFKRLRNKKLRTTIILLTNLLKI